MYWNHHGPEGWAIALMAVGMAVFWVLLFLGALILLRRTGAVGSAGHPRQLSSENADARTAQQILAERFARGEIDEEEYRRRVEVLHDVHLPRRPE